MPNPTKQEVLETDIGEEINKAKKEHRLIGI